jgi:cyclase
MSKPRLCFTLLYSDGSFYLSRNFNLQAVGSFEWLIDNYEFNSIARSVDELIILNVSRGEINWPNFLDTVQKLVRECFMPVAVGGGISNIDHARLLFGSGADKIVINSAFFNSPEMVTRLVSQYGVQSIVASLDFRLNEVGVPQVFTGGGRVNIGRCLVDAISHVEKIGAGELYLTSIDRDGTGMGYDLLALKEAYSACDLPIIAAGGADTTDRLAEGIQSGFATGVSTSHLFNFMGDGLQYARQQLIADGIALSHWNFDGIK